MNIRPPDWLVVWLLKQAKRNPIASIYGTDGTVYMDRYTMFKREWLWVRLHITRRSDEDREMHDHPWRNLSWVLAGGYIEHMPGRSVDRTPGALVWRGLKDRHRLELHSADDPNNPDALRPSISLFFTGRWRQMWGFFEADGTKVPWRMYLRRKERRIRIMKERRHDHRQ